VNYVGVDYHKKYSYMVVKNEDGYVKRGGTVNNTKEEVQQFLEPYRPGMAVVEATRNWGLIYDWLDEVLDDVTLAHPLKVKAIAEARIKTDKISADILADLLRADLLPKAYAPSKQTRDIKNILRQRMFFVRIQTMVKNRIYDILDRHPEVLSQVPDASDLFGAAGMQWLGQTTLSGEDGMLLSSEIRLLKYLKEEITQSNGIVKSSPKRRREQDYYKVSQASAHFSLCSFYTRLTILADSGMRRSYVPTLALSPRRMPQAVKCFTAGLPRRVTNG
jgi:hypothetical protein